MATLQRAGSVQHATTDLKRCGNRIVKVTWLPDQTVPYVVPLQTCTPTALLHSSSQHKNLTGLANI